MIIKKEWTISSFLWVLLLVQGANVLSSDTIRLYGKASSYANERLTFYTYSDYITKDTLHLASTHVANDGTFNCIFTSAQIRKIFVILEMYKCYMYVEPGRSYELVLPDKKDKNKSQKLNPYFKGIPVHIGIKNSTPHELNYQISHFSNQYNQILNKNANNVKNLSKIRDSIYTKLHNAIQSENEFFQQYKKYKLAALKLSLGYPPQKIKMKLMAEKQVWYNNPAYMELISVLFRDYFKDLFSRHGKAVYYIVNHLRSYAKLDSLVRTKPVMRDHITLRELAIVKGLNDAYYDKSFSQQAIQSMLDTMIKSASHYENRRIAKNIKEKYKMLTTGDPAPEFCLVNTDSNRVCLKDLKGEYIYLGFCNSTNYSCIRHYKTLKNLYKQHKKHFTILIISNAPNFHQMRQFVKHHQYPWTFLYAGDQPQIFEKYHVKNMPAYYFINSRGIIALSPAPFPTENIEEKIYRIMKADGAL